jgi:dsDNA-specific endonuclease/ATPase MutS2
VEQIQANLERNENYILRQRETIQTLKPRVDQFYEIRKQQVAEVLTNNRKAFTDKELKNEYVYNELRDKVAKNWKSANNQLVPGIANIDLISSDEHILSLLRDGLKYREKPQTKSAGSSIAALTSKKTNTVANNSGKGGDDISKLREQAKTTGDKKAWDNLLAARLAQRKR